MKFIKKYGELIFSILLLPFCILIVYNYGYEFDDKYLNALFALYIYILILFIIDSSLRLINLRLQRKYEVFLAVSIIILSIFSLYIGIFREKNFFSVFSSFMVSIIGVRILKRHYKR